jgi:peroxiredoxin
LKVCEDFILLYTILSFVIPWSLVALGIFVLFELIRMNGRILLRLDSLEGQRLANPSRLPGSLKPMQPAPSPQQSNALSIGTPAPEFKLPDLAGSRHTLTEYRGRSLLLVFFNPLCGYCTRMAESLGEMALPQAGGTPMPLLLSTGSPDDNRVLVNEYGLKCPLLLQQGMEVAAQYGATGTPMGYLIDEQGIIVTPITTGADALLALARPKSAQAAEVDTKIGAEPAPTPSTQAVEPSANGHQPGAKCKVTKKPCGRCADRAAETNSAGDLSPTELQAYDLVNLAAQGTMEMMVEELAHRAGRSRRLIVLRTGLAEEELGETEAMALCKFLRKNPNWMVSYQASESDSLLVLSCDPNDRKALPSMLAKVANFAKALTTHIGDGARRVTAEQMERRLELCMLCDRRNADHCSACGCSLATKAGWRTSKCPLGKWPTLDEAKALGSSAVQSLEDSMARI